MLGSSAEEVCTTGGLEAGCMVGPFTGDPIGDTATPITFGGYYPAPNTIIHLQMLEPNEVLNQPQSWLEVQTTGSSSQPAATNGSTTWYPWQMTAAPAEQFRGYFTPGGLVHLRTIAYDNQGNLQTLTTFDSNFSHCLDANSAQTWEQIGIRCHSVGNGIATLVSEDPSPDVASNPPNYLSVKGAISELETKNYYEAQQLPASLSDFKTRYVHGDTLTSATYYNDGDLGIGREMYCASFYATFPDPQGPGEACYVTNHGVKRGANGQPILDGNGLLQGAFGGDFHSALRDAQTHTDGFATVAMVYLEGAPDANNRVRFAVYDQFGQITNKARLDTRGQNTSVPNNCLVCHGGGIYYDQTSHGIAGNPAHFLPFDTEQLICDQNGGNCSASDQAEQFRQLNNHVRKTNVTPAIQDLLDGWYGTTPQLPFHGNYIPSGWGGALNAANPSASGRVYNAVFKPFCRTCHVANEIFPFTNYSDFLQNTTVIPNTCQFTDQTTPHEVMPQAEHTQRRFWRSSARAFLSGAFGYYGSCRPE